MLALRPSVISAIIPLVPLTTRKVSPKEGTMLVNWLKDADSALEQAKTQNKPLLIDFSAAPA